MGEVISRIVETEALVHGPLSLFNVLGTLAAAAIIYVVLQAWASRPRIENGVESPTSRAPDDLHPARAGALASGQIGSEQIEATVLHLAQRGVLTIEPDAETGDQVQIRLNDSTAAHTDFETVLVAMIRQRATNGVIRHKSLRRIPAGLGSIRRTLRHDLERRGWFQAGWNRQRLAIVLAGWAGAGIGAMGIVLAIAVGDGWPVLGAFTSGIAGLVAFGLHSVLPHTTHEGERVALPWRSYRTGLILARNGDRGSIDLDEAFPYIVAMGLSASYDQHFRRASQTGYVPDWLQPTEIVQSWPESWYVYWISLHTALAPTDSANTRPPSGSTRKRLFGGRLS